MVGVIVWTNEKHHTKQRAGQIAKKDMSHKAILQRVDVGHLTTIYYQISDSEYFFVEINLPTFNFFYIQQRHYKDF